MSAMVNKTVNKPYSRPLISEGPGYEDLRAISGPVWGRSRMGQYEVILDPFWTHSRPVSQKPHGNQYIYLHLAVGRAL